MIPTTSGFEAAPLLTPERLAAPDWRRCFDIVPEWAAGRFLRLERVFFPLAGVKPLVIHMPPLEAGVALELTRYGHTIVSNANDAGRPDAPRYAKLSPRGAPEHTMPLRRILSGAGKGDFTSALEIASDYSAANAFFKPDARARKDARALALRLAEEQVTISMGIPFDTLPYLANLQALLAALDEARGLTSPVAELLSAAPRGDA